MINRKPCEFLLLSSLSGLTRNTLDWLSKLCHILCCFWSPLMNLISKDTDMVLSIRPPTVSFHKQVQQLFSPFLSVFFFCVWPDKIYDVFCFCYTTGPGSTGSMSDREVRGTRFYTWARGYKTFFMLNSAEHEILNARKLKNVKKIGFF